MAAAQPVPPAHAADLPRFARALAEPGALAEMLDTLDQGVYLVDRRRTIRFWNRACERISGYPARDVVGHRCVENILRHVDEDGRRLCFRGCPLLATMRDCNARSCHVWLHHKDGRRIPVHVRTAPIREPDGRVIGAIEFFVDDSTLTNAQRRAAELEQAVLTDPLTQLPNRRFLDLTLPTRLAEERRHKHGLGVAFLDIDHFKTVNDTHGHLIGDRALQMVAGTLAANLRTSDILCRYGGDEFVLVMSHTNPAEFTGACERLLALVSASSLDLEPEKELTLTLSVGATTAREDDDATTILERADNLLYRTKNHRRHLGADTALRPRAE